MNDLMFTGQRVKWIIDEKTKKKSHITVLNSPCVSVNSLRLSYLKVGRMKTNVTKISTLPTGHS